MLIFGLLLVPMVLAAPTDLAEKGPMGKHWYRRLRAIRVKEGIPEKLDLSGYGWADISDNVFENVTHVKSINLANNHLHFLNPSTFSILRELENMSVANNEIFSIDISLFSRLSNLKFLNISKNPMRKLTRTPLYGRNEELSTELLMSRLPSRSTSLVRVSELPVGLTEHPDGKRPFCKVTKAGALQDILRYDKPINIELDSTNCLEINDDILPAGISRIDLSGENIAGLKKGIINNKHVKHIKLSNNFISEIEDGALEGLELVTVDLHKNRLNNTRFVTTLPLTLEILMLSENCINELVPDTFSRFHELNEIDFADNNISVIRRESLRGLNSAEELTLSRNNIENIEPGAFRYCKHLRRLKLDGNKLTTFDKGMLDGLPILNYLDLSSNNIKQIVHYSFHGSLNAGGPFSSSNEIKISETSGTFVQGPTHELKPKNDKKWEIEHKTTGAKTHLQGLNLQNNSLSLINGDEFAALENIRYLNLANNAIINIENGFAKHLINVVMLDLSNNPIEKIENGSLVGLPKTRNWVIETNNVHLEILHRGIFDSS